MRSALIRSICVLAFAIATQTANADGILLTWSPGDIIGVTEQTFNEAKLVKVDDILKKNLNVSTWGDTYLLAVGASANKENKTLLNGLVAQLTDTTKVNLKDTNRLIIWERIKSGEILFEGKGFQINDDLFTVAGRANWILRNLSRKNLGYVKSNSTPEELTALQQKWTRWIKGESVEEVANPYATSIKGLEEIRSREALEALIISLKPSSEKEKLTKDCLKRLYNTDKLPSDPNSPATMCSPDRYTHGYLRVITGITDQHDYDWWKKWWDTNANLLKWSPENGLFVVPKP